MNRIIFICAFLLLSGCAGFQQGGDDFQDINYYVGTKGITMRFMPDRPPSFIFEEWDFDAQVIIKNEGAYHLTGDPIPAYFFANVDPLYITKKEEEPTIVSRLFGRSDLLPTGQEFPITVANLKANGVRGQLHSPDTKVTVTACYPYKTLLKTSLCMDFTRQQFNEREHVCKARDLSFSTGQGAPVAIDYVEVGMMPIGLGVIRPTFVIHIDNVGGGLVLRPATKDVEKLCSLQFENSSEMNTLKVNASIGNRIPLECTPDPVQLINDDTRIFCTVNENVLQNNIDNFFGLMDNFVTTLTVELDYIYTSTQSTVVEIRRAYPTFSDSKAICGDKGNCCTYQKEDANGNCIDLCKDEGKQFSCSCGTFDCAKNPGSCLGEDNLCEPGVFCCQLNTCQDARNAQECKGLNEELGCVYCETERKCTATCNSCENSIKQGTSCVEIREVNEETLVT